MVLWSAGWLLPLAAGLGLKVPYDTKQLKGFYTERICGTLFTDRCLKASPRIVCGQDYCAQLAPYHAVLHLKAAPAVRRQGRQAGQPRVIDSVTPEPFRPFCGATLISEKWLVTAAHCVHANREGEGYCARPETRAAECRAAPCPPGCHRVLPEQLQVSLGLTDITELEAAEVHDVDTIVIHPGWDLLAKDNNILAGHDIALVRLAREAALSDRVWPACLPDPVLSQGLAEVGAEVTVVGFGTTNTTTKAMADVLQLARLFVVATNACTTPNASAAPGPARWGIAGDQVCARGQNTEAARRCFRDSCKGDSGGALISSSFGRQFLIGVVSFGETYCGGLDNPRPGVYTNVTSHLQWVRDARLWVEGGAGGWAVWAAWGTCSASCGPGRRTRKRECGARGRTSEPVLGHLVGAACEGEPEEEEACTASSCPPVDPGLLLIQGIHGIFGNLGTVILGPAPTPAPTPASPEKDEEEEEAPGTGLAGTCTSYCPDWPYSQCKVELRRVDGSWQAATCIHPFIDRPGPFQPWPQKFSNYPECGEIPPGCSRCDDYCALRDGRAGREDY